ncbi:MAG: NADH-quinone oxidoreductase subunit K [Thermoactinomyces sp.]
MLVSVLCLLLILTSLLASEYHSLTGAVKVYLGQALLLVLILATYAFYLPNHALLLWSLTVLISKVVIIPCLLWRYLKKVDSNELGTILPAPLSIVIGIVVTAGSFGVTYLYYPLLTLGGELSKQPFHINMSAAVAIMAVGLYALLNRRHAVKAVIGLCLLENGVHMSLVSLAPSIPETAMIGIVTDVVISVWMLLYIAGQIYSLAGLSDTCKLSKLRG